MTKENPPIYLTPRQVADRFEMSTNTLTTWRMRKTAMPYIKFGRKVLYDLKDVEEFEKNSKIKITNTKTKHRLKTHS